ncbi:MAG TPA: CoA ester lyase [Burkholderiaceae bacterium]|nr:CoA ester lyase [Burkholderiaceae bacterium]
MNATDPPTLPSWRSILFVPLTSERFLAKAHQRGADAIQLDLEDGVALDAKDAARARLADAIDHLAAHEIDVIVRINRPWRLAFADLQVAVRPGVSAITLPKVEDAGRVRALDELVGEFEVDAGVVAGSIGFVLLVETPAALPRLAELAAASKRTVAMTLGPEDYSLAAGCAPDADALLVPNLLVAQAAAAAGVRALGFVGSIGDYGDLQAFRQTIRRARRLGFTGAQVVHPAQVPILNEEFAPSAEELDWARRVVDAARDAGERGIGAFEVDGKMVDLPIVKRAEQLLARSR